MKPKQAKEIGEIQNVQNCLEHMARYMGSDRGFYWWVPVRDFCTALEEAGYEIKKKAL